jgi:tetratricopeptide (TPR) repeat protein
MTCSGVLIGAISLWKLLIGSTRRHHLLQSQHWHTCYEWILLEGRLVEEALVHFKKAIELDSKSWRKRSRSLEVSNRNRIFQEAVPVLQRALEAIPEQLKGGITDLQCDLTKMMLHMGHYEAALRQSKASFYSEPTELGHVGELIEPLYACERYENIIRTIKSVKSQFEYPRDWVNFFFVGLTGVNQEIGRALRLRGEVDFITDLINMTDGLDP